MKNKKIVNWMGYWLAIGVGVFVLVFLVTSTWIGVSVRNQCLVARARYDGDCVEALIQTLQSEENSLRERNYAIWALGQMGDRRAMPVLEQFYTGKMPDREPYDQTLSQYEMKKAIKLVEGGFNITAVVWRNGLN